MAKKYLINNEGQFYKANMHCHSTHSDGKMTPEQLKELYMQNGYSIICFTDHNNYIYHKELDDEKFLALAGFEADIATSDWKYCYHLNAFAKDPENCINDSNRNLLYRHDENGNPYVYSVESVNKFIKRLNDNGFFVMYNHPSWSLQTPKDFMELEGVWALEIYNHSCECENRTGYDGVFYDMMLRSGKKYKCLATDDNHNWTPFDKYGNGACGGWIMVKAPKLEYKSVINAIYDGQFYSSQGPEIYSIYVEDGYIHLDCSPIQSAYLLIEGRDCPVYHCNDGATTHVSFKLEDWFGYVRFEIFDKERKMAMTNPYYIKEILKK